MRRTGSFVSYTLNELSKLDSQTDWAKVDALSREGIERQAQIDEGPLPDRWEETIVLGIPRAKRGLYLRLDPDVVDWFKSHGPGVSDANQRGASSFRSLTAGGAARGAGIQMIGPGLLDRDAQGLHADYRSVRMETTIAL